MAAIRDLEYIDEDFVPPVADVAAKAVAQGVGLDTAAVLTRRDIIKTARDAVAAKIPTYKARAGSDADVGLIFDGLLATLDATIAAGFDA